MGVNFNLLDTAIGDRVLNRAAILAILGESSSNQWFVNSTTGNDGNNGTSPTTPFATIKAADEKKVEWRNVSSLLGKKLLKEELKSVRDAFESEDVINLPAERSVWRVSNAISWIAGKTADGDRRLELQRLAGAVIHGKAEEAA